LQQLPPDVDPPREIGVRYSSQTGPLNPDSDSAHEIAVRYSTQTQIAPPNKQKREQKCVLSSRTAAENHKRVRRDEEIHLEYPIASKLLLQDDEIAYEPQPQPPQLKKMRVLPNLSRLPILSSETVPMKKKPLKIQKSLPQPQQKPRNKSSASPSEVKANVYLSLDNTIPVTLKFDQPIRFTVQKEEVSVDKQTGQQIKELVEYEFSASKLSFSSNSMNC
jgi:hypothetical protein